MLMLTVGTNPWLRKENRMPLRNVISRPLPSLSSLSLKKEREKVMFSCIIHGWRMPNKCKERNRASAYDSFPL